MLTLALNYYFAYSAKKTVAIKAELYHGRLQKKIFRHNIFQSLWLWICKFKKCILTFLCCFESLDRRRTRPVSKRSLWMSRSDLPWYPLLFPKPFFSFSPKISLDSLAWSVRSSLSWIREKLVLAVPVMYLRNSRRMSLEAMSSCWEWFCLVTSVSCKGQIKSSITSYDLSTASIGFCNQLPSEGLRSLNWQRSVTAPVVAKPLVAKPNGHCNNTHALHILDYVDAY